MMSEGGSNHGGNGSTVRISASVSKLWPRTTTDGRHGNFQPRLSPRPSSSWRHQGDRQRLIELRTPLDILVMLLKLVGVGVARPPIGRSSQWDEPRAARPTDAD